MPYYGRESLSHRLRMEPPSSERAKEHFLLDSVFMTKTSL